MSGGVIITVNPDTGQELKRYPLTTPAETGNRLENASRAQAAWRKSKIEARAQALNRLASLLRMQKESLALLIQQEMGKTIDEARAEIEKCASCADFYAENTLGFLAPMKKETEAAQSFVCFEPLGIVLAIMPWNFPFWQAFRCAIPAIAAGNGIVLKHASNVTGSSLEIERLWQASLGEYKDLFQSFILKGEHASELIKDPRIAAVSFTGSTEVGRKIASQAGQSLKKSVLELGGSDAYVVLRDADIDLAAKVCASSRLINWGQSCIAAKRFIVEEPVLDRFLHSLQKEMANAPPRPLAREDLRSELHRLVEDSIQQGARLICGGEIPVGSGWKYPATILAEVRPDMPVFRQETFGPVAAVVSAKSEHEAIRLANLSAYGLGAAVFSGNLDRGVEIASRELNAGSCFVNDFVRSDPRLPFGGIKDSGYGRELSDFGMREFVNIKTVYAKAP